MRADGIELLGQLQGSGYANVPFLVRRSDGQTLQLTSLLYATLACVDGRRTYAEIASCLSAEIDRQILAEDVACLVEEKLEPLGLLCAPDGAQPTVDKANPLLGLRWRFVVSNPRITRRITRPFAQLFRSFAAIPLLVVFAVTSGWLLLDKGLASATHEALYQPGLLLLIFALTMLSAGFHEFGHAAACRYGGATPGAMGAGLYLVWPAFYTEVSDCYRLGRWGRVRVDVGGLYFNAIFAAGMFAVWWFTRWDALLLVIPAQVLQMLRQLLPFVRFDGYHILADITGVPDLFSHIKPTLTALLPSRWRRPQGNHALKPWARAVVSIWVLLVIPVLLFSLVMMVKVMPRVAATAWDSLGQQADVLNQNWNDGSWADVAVRLLAMFTIALPVASMGYMLLRVVRRTARKVWRATQDRPVRRTLAVLAAAGLLALLTWAWWPEGQYRPIEAHERGTLLQALAAEPTSVQPQLLAAAAAAAPQPVAAESLYSIPTTGLRQMVGPGIGLPEATDGEDLQARVGLVLTPRTADGGQAESEAEREQQVIVLPKTGDTSVADPWAFPFNPPRAPRAGDNQALAVNTTDGSSLYDVSLALVWVTEGDQVPVDQRNEAYALASCTDCSTVAVAFQVILVIGQADVVVPENIAMAVNYDCIECDTYALAVQLIATLTDMPSDDAMRQLESVWDELELLEQNIADVPLDELHSRLATIESAILQILASDKGLSSPAVAEDSVDEAGTPTPVATTGAAADGEATTTGDEDSGAATATEPATSEEQDSSGSTTTTTTEAPTAQPSAEPTVEPTAAEPSPEPAAEESTGTQSEAPAQP